MQFPFSVRYRYGPIFKTSLVGHPVVVSADEELNHLVFQQEGELFQSWYPDSFVEILGRDNVGEQQGTMFKYLKNMVLRFFGPESLRECILRDVERAVCTSLCTWSTLPAVELKEAVSTVIPLSISYMVPSAVHNFQQICRFLTYGV
jgi:hypothetical protein